MERYKRCAIRVNKELVKREVIYKFGSITKYCDYCCISRTRFWEIVNKPHLSKEALCLRQLARDLNLSVEDILL